MRDITCSQTPSANYESIHTAFENYNYHLATSYLHTSNNCCEDSSATSVSRLAVPSWYYHLDLQKKGKTHDLRDRSAVRDHAHRAHHLREVTARDDGRGLVVDTFESRESGFCSPEET